MMHAISNCIRLWYFGDYYDNAARYVSDLAYCVFDGSASQLIVMMSIFLHLSLFSLYPDLFFSFYCTAFFFPSPSPISIASYLYCTSSHLNFWQLICFFLYMLCIYLYCIPPGMIVIVSFILSPLTCQCPYLPSCYTVFHCIKSSFVLYLLMWWYLSYVCLVSFFALGNLFVLHN